jgi:hypothetical protein
VGYVWQRWLADALRDEGCRVREVDGWENRGRPASSGGFEPQGATHHHTGTHTSYNNPNPTLNTCIQGRSDLPGPLCQVLIGYDGTCWVIAAGRANHAGTNNGFGPYSHGDGNSQSFGWEIDYDGSQKPSPEQIDAAERASAAVLRKKQHQEKWVVIHKETSTTGKWDTGQRSGDQWRSGVKKRLAGEDDDMPYNDWPDKDKKALAADVVDALLTRDLYGDDKTKDVSVGRALRVAENAGNKILDEK